MSVNDYMDQVRRRNGRIFKAAKVTMTPSELEKHLRHAFISGQESGRTAEKAEKSLFDQLFGKAPWNQPK